MRKTVSRPPPSASPGWDAHAQLRGLGEKQARGMLGAARFYRNRPGPRRPEAEVFFLLAGARGPRPAPDMEPDVKDAAAHGGDRSCSA
ncbi:hypothetical protein HispidOSU_009202 [Sigmodon hispidus]